MLPSDLTTLANAKQWLNVTAASDDLLLARMISAASGFVQAWLNRQIASQSYAESRDGSGMGAGRRFMVLANRPVTAIQSLVVDTYTIMASPDNGQLQPGYGYDDTSIWLANQAAYANSFWPNGFEFTRGRRNVIVKYTAGYLKTETQTIPGAPYQVTPLFPWNGDRGITFTVGGAALTLVASAPAAGQYSVNSSTGVYTFNAADTTKGIVLSYSYTPFEIEQAVIELIGLRYREKERIGQVSKSIAGEVVAFSQKDMSDDIKTLLQNYRKVVPL